MVNIFDIFKKKEKKEEKVNLAEKAAEKYGNLGEQISTSGYFFMGGVSQAEYQKDLKNGKAMEIYDKMSRSDGLVAAIVRVCTLPLLSAKWYVKPPNDKDDNSVEMAKKIENNLIKGGLADTWNNALTDILRHIVYGYYPLEIVWKNPVDDPVKNPDKELPMRVKKLSAINPKTVQRWHFDKFGEVKDIEQWAYFNIDDTTQYKMVRVPAEKLLIFTNNKEGDNYEGVSILRPSYKHWRIKENIYNFQNVGAEKASVGFPVVTYDKEYYDLLTEEKAEVDAAVDDFLKNFRIHEKSGAKLPYFVHVEVKDGKFNGAVLDRIIFHHDCKMAQSVLASFLMLGESGGGSFALSKDQSDFFLKGLTSIGKNVCDTINRHLIPKIVDFNYDGENEYPELCFEFVDFDSEKFIATLNAAVSGSLVTPDRDIEQATRRILELPELKEGEISAAEQAKEAIEEDAGLPKEAKFSEGIHSHAPVWRRELTRAEKKVNFADIKKTMDTAEDRIVKEISGISKRQIKEIVNKVKGGESLTAVKVPFMDEVKKLFQSEFVRLANYGKKQIGEEFNKNIKDSGDIEKMAALQAELKARKHEADLLNYVAMSLPLMEVKG